MPSKSLLDFKTLHSFQPACGVLRFFSISFRLIKLPCAKANPLDSLPSSLPSNNI